MRDNPKYDNPAKDVAWQAYLKATDNRMKGDLPLDDINIKTAETNFENWWKRNHE